jgi:peptidoglycan hydrolase-like protein with peptidoglycan-binding domain
VTKARPSRRRALVAAAVAALVAAAVVFVLADPFGDSASGQGKDGRQLADALVPVQRRSLSARHDEEGTLGYAGEATIVAGLAGTVTALPHVGEVIRPGEVLYRVDHQPVLLLHGKVPAYRTLSEGRSGRDVRQLNADLVALGYAEEAELDPESDYFGWATVEAVEALQEDLGVEEDGELALGEVVFLPTAARITELAAVLGGPVRPGATVATATSTRRQVVVEMDPTTQSEVKRGDRVTITLPNEKTTLGVISKVGKVAAAAPGEAGQPEAEATIEVDVRPLHQKATGTLDEAPVTVSIVTATVKDALVVPVTALLATAEGGYAVEVAAGAARRLVGVQVGLFDDADGLVQVSGDGIAAGDEVVVPSR